MQRRRNALVGAAQLIAEIDRIGLASAQGASVDAGSASATVVDAWPNNRINIPHRCTFYVGILHPTEAGVLAMNAEMNAAMARIAEDTGLAFNILEHRQRNPFHFDPTLTALVEQVAGDAGHSVTRMRTRPGHDAFNMTLLCPTQLIFVPCRDGLSHNELEWCTPEHCEAGATVLLRSVLARAMA
jgi:N-carbamoyl-L-amino-acid hydrolase